MWENNDTALKKKYSDDVDPVKKKNEQYIRIVFILSLKSFSPYILISITVFRTKKILEYMILEISLHPSYF